MLRRYERLVELGFRRLPDTVVPGQGEHPLAEWIGSSGSLLGNHKAGRR
jgi:hypothetical protein